jgi:hypothetical protein
MKRRRRPYWIGSATNLHTIRAVTRTERLFWADFQPLRSVLRIFSFFRRDFFLLGLAGAFEQNVTVLSTFKLPKTSLLSENTVIDRKLLVGKRIFPPFLHNPTANSKEYSEIV